MKSNLFFLFCFLYIFVTFASNSVLGKHENKSLELLATINQTTLPAQSSLENLYISSLLNFDVRPKIMQKTAPSEGENYICLESANVNTMYSLMPWLLLNAELSYFNSNKGQGDLHETKGLFLDDAFVTFGDFSKSRTLFLRCGKFYLPFGSYDRFSISPNLVNLLTISRANAIEVGYVHNYQSSIGAYVAQGLLTRLSDRIQGDLNGGMWISYETSINENGFIKIGTQYMSNILNTNALSQGGRYTNNSHVDGDDPKVFTRSIDGIAFQVELKYMHSLIYFQGVRALKFSPNIIKYYIDQTNGPLGSKPASWMFGYTFETLCKNITTKLHLTYEYSIQSSGLNVFNSMTYSDIKLGVPRNRYTVGLELNITQNVSCMFLWVHNHYVAIPGVQGDDAIIRLQLRV